jgi:hypothetical protein
LKGQAQGGTDAGSLVKYPRPEHRFPLASKTPAGRAAYQLPSHAFASFVKRTREACGNGRVQKPWGCWQSEKLHGARGG